VLYLPILRRLVGDEYDLAGVEARLLCPVHQERTGHPDNRPSFYFNVESGLCICFSCGYHGNAEQLWGFLRGGSDMPDPVAEIPADERMTLLSRRWAPISASYLGEVEISSMPEADLLGFDKPTDDMLNSRGITAEAAEELQIRASASRGVWVVPIRHAVSGMLMGIQTKLGKQVRNLPSGVGKGMSLFGLQQMDLTQPTLIVESPLDVAVCLSHGVQAVATYGASISDLQLNIIRGMSQPILAFDNDRAGKQVTSDISRSLRKDARMVLWPDGIKDPGDMGLGITEVPTVSLMTQSLRTIR
jgi:Toprim-like